ncbi:MAG: hypothetical protein ACT6RN_25005 [Agrobacterium sp.]|uniref:hypothetical protein n=1 Tax=Agrobacterium sp. TaxID=361 RepID=UPI0040375FEB
MSKRGKGGKGKPLSQTGLRGDASLNRPLRNPAVVLARLCPARPDSQGRSGAVAPVCPPCGPGDVFGKN